MANREVYLAESRGLWRSRDARRDVGQGAAPPGHVHLRRTSTTATARVSTRSCEGKGLFRTDNADEVGRTAPPRDRRRTRSTCHPHQKNTILLTSRTTGLWISTDKGETVTPARRGHPGGRARDHAASRSTPSNPTAWLAATDTGAIFASEDRGATWAKVSNLGVPRDASSLADPSSPSAWIAVGPGVYSSTDGGGKWTTLYASADPEERVVALERLADGTWIALLEREARVVASHDGGKTWDAEALKRPAATKTAWGAGLAVDAKDPKHLLVATRTTADTWSKDDKDGGPYESKDGGATWTALDEGFKSDKGVVREWWNRGAVCAIDPNHGTMFYGADGVGLFSLEVAADGKSAWVEVALTGASRPSPRSTRSLMTPSAPDVSIATTIVAPVRGLEHAHAVAVDRRRQDVRRAPRPGRPTRLALRRPGPCPGVG